MSCKSGWYEQHFYDGAEGYSSLVPAKLIDCQTSDNGEGREYFAEVAEMVQITMFLGLLLLLFAMYRSCSRTRTDWYRLIAIYILGTLGYPISILLGPSQGGFNRIIGFGILVHNFAEVCILGHIWHGAPQVRMAHNSFATMWVILYVWLIMALIAFVPLVALFPILMAQGAFCDWTLVVTFVFLGWWMDNDAKGDKKGGEEHRKEMGCYGRLGTAAAVLHILSIEPLFFGIASTMNNLGAITVVCLMPTFILYIWFSAADKNNPPIIISPNPPRNKVLVEMEHSNAAQQLSAIIELKQRRTAADSDGAAGRSEEKEQRNPDRDDDVEDVESEVPTMTYGKVIRVGLMNLDPKNRKRGAFVALIGFVVSFSNVMLIYFAPCFLDLQPIVCK